MQIQGMGNAGPIAHNYQAEKKTTKIEELAGRLFRTSAAQEGKVTPIVERIVADVTHIEASDTRFSNFISR
jgi:hypothetical protein